MYAYYFYYTQVIWYHFISSNWLFKHMEILCNSPTKLVPLYESCCPFRTVLHTGNTHTSLAAGACCKCNVLLIIYFYWSLNWIGCCYSDENTLKEPLKYDCINLLMDLFVFRLVLYCKKVSIFTLPSIYIDHWAALPLYNLIVVSCVFECLVHRNLLTNIIPF